MPKLQSKITQYGAVFTAVIQDPKKGAEVRIFCDGRWLGIGKVKNYPDCKITGAIRDAYGDTMKENLQRLSKRLTKKAEKRAKKKAEKRAKKNARPKN